MRPSPTDLTCFAERQRRPDNLGLILVDGEPPIGVTMVQDRGLAEVHPVDGGHDSYGRGPAVQACHDADSLSGTGGVLTFEHTPVAKPSKARLEAASRALGTDPRQAARCPGVVLVQTHRSAPQPIQGGNMRRRGAAFTGKTGRTFP